MRGKISIVQANRASAGDVFRLQEQFDSYMQGLTPRRRHVQVGRRWRMFLRYGFGKKPLFKCLVARSAGRPVGYVCYHPGYDPDEAMGPVAYVVDLFVSENERGLGIGTSLLREVSRACGRDGVAIYFCVWKRNHAAIRFYKSIGADWVDSADTPFMEWPRKAWRR